MFLLLALVFAVSTSPAVTVDPSTYRAEIEKWRADRVRRLTSEDGWLSVVGLSWLEEGVNAIGSSPKSRVVLPAGRAPEILGTIRLAGGKAMLEVTPGVVVTLRGKPVRSLEMLSDEKGEPTVVRHGTLSFFPIRRGDRLGIRVKDSASPARAAFHGIESYPIDSRWRVDARLVPHQPKKSIAVPNVLGNVTNEPSPGALVFTIRGREYRIDAVDEEGTDDLFLIFGDSTNGSTTYGAGRFLYAPRPGKDGTTVVDFNKAYNPPCAFTAFATCPLPPPQNRLPVAVDAGEKSYGDH